MREFPSCTCFRGNGYHDADCEFEQFCRNSEAGPLWYEKICSHYCNGGTTSFKQGGILALNWALNHLDELVDCRMKQLAAAKAALKGEKMPLPWGETKQIAKEKGWDRVRMDVRTAEGTSHDSVGVYPRRTAMAAQQILLSRMMEHEHIQPLKIENIEDEIGGGKVYFDEDDYYNAQDLFFQFEENQREAVVIFVTLINTLLGAKMKAPPSPA